MQSTMIELSGVTKSFRQKKKVVPALRDVNLEVKKGSYLTIMGPSGCGKSTITKLIAGIETMDAGRLVIDGVDCSKKVPVELKKRIGYVFQWHNLAEWRTVEQNLYLPLEIFGEKKNPEWEKRATKYLEFVGLGDYRGVFPHELSGGMRQRVGIARAMMNEPDILVFDQPFGALDAITRKQIAQIFSDAMREDGKTVIIISSNIDEAIQYSDNICFLTANPGTVKKLETVPFTYEERQKDGFLMTDAFLDYKRELLQLIES